MQNYPNPFNPSTVISWNLAAGSFVSLKVYDFLGREIAVLINEEMPAGSHSLEFSAKTVDTSELASGTYFYKLHAGQNYEVRKIVLIR